MGLQEDWDSATPDLSKEWDAAAPQAQKKGPPPGFWDENPTARTVMRYGLPLATAAATIPFTGGMSLPMILATEGMASLGSEAVNQALGVNDRDSTQLGLALAAPGVGRSVGGILANIPRMVPGFGEALRSAITPEMRELPKKLFGGASSKELYDQLSKQAGPLQRVTKFPELSKAIQEVETNIGNVPWDNMAQRLKATGHTELLEQMKQTIAGVPPTVGMAKPTVGGRHLPAAGLPPNMGVVNQGRLPGLDFNEARASVEGLGQLIRSTSNDAERGVYKKLYNAMLSDLEKAPSSGNKQIWDQARAAFKRERAQFSLQEATERAIKTKDGVDVIDPNQIVKWLRTNDEIKSRVSPTEYRAILNEYRYMASVAGHNMSKFTAMIVGGFASGGAGGALAGYLGAEQLTKVMMTEGGRKVVRALASDPSQSNFRRFMMMAGVEAKAAISGGDSIQLEN